MRGFPWRRQTDFTSRAGGSASAGVQGSLPHFANSGHLFVLPRHTLYSLYNTFTSMFSFLSRVLRSPMYVQVGEIKKVLPTREGHAQSWGACRTKLTIPVLQINKIRRGKGHAQDYAARLAEAFPGLTLPHWASAFPSVNQDWWLLVCREAWPST